MMTEEKYPEFGVLLVDDEKLWLRGLSMALACSAGINNIHQCDDSRQVMNYLATHNIRVVLLDLTMPHISGEELLKQITQEHPEVAVIVISGMNQLETAVNCMKLGAFDYFVKTNEQERLLKGIHRAIRMIELQNENHQMKDRFLNDKLDSHDAFADIITQDKGVRKIFQYMESVARSSQPVLITGESGVGKELFSRAVHTLSGRSGPIIAVNVAGLDDNVFADTLFGHVKGAFTGAEVERPGMIEQAANGTLFLDEIGDMSIPSQVKLLRLLQEGEYFPLGRDQPKWINARIVVATHQSLEEKMKAGTFRKDLYYRLCTHHIHIPALRERKEDLPLLLDHFMTLAAESLEKKKPTPPKELVTLLSSYHFPGNVRELRAMVYDAISVHKSKILSMETFCKAIGKKPPALDAPPSRDGDEKLFASSENLPTLTEATEALIDEAIERAQGNQTIAARMLGITQPSLSNRLKRSRKKIQE
ncbi:two component, sigma54 specific, transcriptional regulator, Fis family [Desulfuromonas acetoxidans DSM 684]|uniref:Two component, sigma54 specific, transcriptional regulator, Fis family n=2 Tax=Desulfuromonas acetoxidans TaxID=891 RepID=Q1JYW9_DESA6|nr:sigma-54 dependent transcriptional regulator [Desulfuromonas acetoxidans]EAT15525.1 two component, sigma54 specific, transcriptional regulator, Fis family [Desulfuromonas acetoxidans DSM 684]